MISNALNIILQAVVIMVKIKENEIRDKQFLELMCYKTIIESNFIIMHL